MDVNTVIILSKNSTVIRAPIKSDVTGSSYLIFSVFKCDEYSSVTRNISTTYNIVYVLYFTLYVNNKATSI